MRSARHVRDNSITSTSISWSQLLQIAWSQLLQIADHELQITREF